jgi:Zn-dependent M28 family amino/carboxypeptidase
MTRARTALRILPVLLVLAACGQRAPDFDVARITRDVQVLSADDFAGRAPATPEEEKTVAYIVSQLQEAGLEPGGDPLPGGGRAWTQDVPLRRAVMTSPGEVSVKAGRETIALEPGGQVAIRAAQTGATEVQLTDVPLVFVGYGVTAPERQWDDFKDVDVKGKVLLILVNDPDFEGGEADFGGRAMTYYGRWVYKYEEAARRGAAGALVIHETEPASYGWATVRNSNTAEMFDVRRADPLAVHVPVEGWIQRDVAADLLRRAELDFEQLKAVARTRAFRPVELRDVTFSTRFGVQVDEVVAKNVVGVLPGREHPDEWVIYTAHHDHLGTGGPDARGDTIYNGAVDNAGGTAQVLELARAFAGAKRTQRSLMFLFVGAEEKGLLGSEYYATSPLYPLARTVANLNTDSPRPTGPARDFSTSGDAPLTLQDMLVEEGRKLGRRYSPEPRPEAGLFFRSDHFSFARRGVPAISFKSGEDLVDGGLVAGKAWSEAYTRDRYHQQADDFVAAEWRSDGIANDAALLYALGRRLADSREWPEWKAGAEFKAVRDATAAERD